MSWLLYLALGFFVLVIGVTVMRGRSIARLYTAEHLARIAAAIPDLKRRALAGTEGEPASVLTSLLAIGYSIRRDEAGWIHHISVSNPITPARATGTYFLGLVRALLGLERAQPEVFVSQNNVFHLAVTLDDEAQASFAASPVPTIPEADLPAIASREQAVLAPLLAARQVVAPTP